MRKNTEKQKQILSVLEKSNEALSAAQIHKEVPHIDLATVYRTVDKFSEEGVIKKLILNGKKAMYEHTQDSHHHAVCDNCENIIHFHIDEKELANLVSIPHFDIADIEIVVRGKHKNS